MYSINLLPIGTGQIAKYHITTVHEHGKEAYILEEDDHTGTCSFWEDPQTPRSDGGPTYIYTDSAWNDKLSCIDGVANIEGEIQASRFNSCSSQSPAQVESPAYWKLQKWPRSRVGPTSLFTQMQMRWFRP